LKHLPKSFRLLLRMPIGIVKPARSRWFSKP
jgi:hypothetical protein